MSSYMIQEKNGKMKKNQKIKKKEFKKKQENKKEQKYHETRLGGLYLGLS